MTLSANDTAEWGHLKGRVEVDDLAGDEPGRSPDESTEAHPLGFIPTQYFTFGEEPADRLSLDFGRDIGPVTLAYETYGELNATRTNAVMVLHALSGDAHVAGMSAEDGRLGWWEALVGPDKGIDTNKYFVICSNVLGGCKGSTGPASINPATGKPYGASFPILTIGDMVRAQKRLLEHLGIERLLGAIGGSMGGMQALQWAVQYPQSVAGVMPVATAACLSAQGLAWNEIQRQAILADPNWHGGDYYADDTQPGAGLAIARMIGHVTYLSDIAMDRKFARRRQGHAHNDTDYGYSFDTEFAVESYLTYQSRKFLKRFDANTYMYIMRAMDYFDLSASDDTSDDAEQALVTALRRVQARYLILSYTSDWLYPPRHSLRLAEALRSAGKDVQYFDIEADYGHDAFLLEQAQTPRLIATFLAETLEKENAAQH